MLSQLYKSPIQSHIWLKLNPHSYLFTFWAWSNIVAFREMSWSSSTLVIYHAHSSIKSIKSGSSEALHPWKKKRKSGMRVRRHSYSSNKKKDKGEGWRSQDQTPLKRTFIHHTHAHDQVLRWHDLSKTRFLILQNKWGIYAFLALPRATQKPIKK